VWAGGDGGGARGGASGNGGGMRGGASAEGLARQAVIEEVLSPRLQLV